MVSKSAMSYYAGGEEGLSTFTGILALLSTIIGGGIVGLPYSYLILGLPLAIFLNVAFVLTTRASGTLYLAAKDAIPDKPESLYEIGYMTYGRPAIFVIAGICLLNSFGLMMIYFIVFSDTTGQLVGSFVGLELNDVYYTSRYFYALILAALLIPIILKKELAELKWVSMVLFVSIFFFIIFNLYELTLDSKFERKSGGSPFIAPLEGGAKEIISAVSVTLVAYSY